MQPTSRSALTVYFGSLIVLAIAVSFFMQEPADTAGQVVHTAENSANGFDIAPNTNVYFSCPQQSPLLSESIGDGANYPFWVYEFTGNEPPFTGKYFITQPIASARNIDPSFNSITTLTAGNLYYLRSQVPLTFQCGTGLRPTPVCGNGIQEAAEVCDGVPGCNTNCVAATGYECDSERNTCEALVPKLDPETATSSLSSSSAATAPQPESSSSASQQQSLTQTTSSSSKQRSNATTSQAAPTTPTAPVVQFDEFEMEYVTVPASSDLEKGSAFTIELRIKNTADAPRTFKIVHGTSVSGNRPTGVANPNPAIERSEKTRLIAPDLRHEDSSCETKPSPYFGQWRTFCQYELAPGQERTIEYAFTVEEELSCALAVSADTTLFAKAATYDKRYNRYVSIYPPNECGQNIASPVACVPLAYAQGAGDRYHSMLLSKDGSLAVYKFRPDNSGTSGKAYRLDINTCTETLLTDTSTTNSIGEIYLSNANDILYEVSAWYTSRGRPDRSLHLVDGTTGEEQTIVPYAPKNTGVGSVALSQDGSRVAFVASWVDLDTNPDTSYNNADESAELFVWEDGVITQITNCRDGQYGTYHTCNAVEPVFLGPGNQYVNVKLNYNPITNAPQENSTTYRFYTYDIDKAELVKQLVPTDAPLTY